MNELTDFYNEGFGWICRQCERDLAETRSSGPSRLMLEGEAESKHPELASPAIAKWVDAAQRVLVCPRCGVSESVEKS
ncbi:MAG: hypothetical protein ABI857_03020 [Acidobacteriota bacterium]